MREEPREKVQKERENITCSRLRNKGMLLAIYSEFQVRLALDCEAFWVQWFLSCLPETAVLVEDMICTPVATVPKV